MSELSRSQVDRLGRRLRRAGPTNVSDEDLDLLEKLLAAHAPVLVTVHERLTKALSLPVTPRLKTTDTLVEKLQRNPGMALSRMQDVAGVRLVAEMNRAEQNQLVARIVEFFPGAQVTDRRAVPSHGYRAVHVIVMVNQRLVEIQVRTTLQDLWAQVVERLADRWGRGIRYGDPPNNPDTEVGGGFTRRMMLKELMRLSEVNNSLELVAVKLEEAGAVSVEAGAVSVEARALAESLPTVKDRDTLQKHAEVFQKHAEVFQALKEQRPALEEEARALLVQLRSLQ